MTDQPRTFTAPVTGRYHFVGSRDPHLAEECDGQCPLGVAFNVMDGSTVGFMNSGTATVIPADASAVAYDAK